MTDQHHRVTVQVQTQDQWYAVIREANTWFGPGNWRGQRNVRRKFLYGMGPLDVWFEVPDPKFASYIALKYSASQQPKKE